MKQCSWKNRQITSPKKPVIRFPISPDVSSILLSPEYTEEPIGDRKVHCCIEREFDCYTNYYICSMDFFKRASTGVDRWTYGIGKKEIQNKAAEYGDPKNAEKVLDGLVIMVHCLHPKKEQEGIRGVGNNY